MNYSHIGVLHVDGSLIEIDSNKQKTKIAGLGAYLVINGKIKDKFSKHINNVPFIEHHEEYAILESLKWAKKKGVESLKIRTDSLYAVNLFSGQKKAITQEDKFFLIQYLMLEYSFEWLEIEYCSRESDDLAHELSREYLKHLEQIDVPRTESLENNTSIAIKQSVHKNILEIGRLFNGGNS